MNHIEVSTQGHILLIRLTRPEKYNALSLEMYHGIAGALARLNTDPNLRVAVLHAEGPHFTAGIEPAASRSAKETTSALMKPFSKSVWMTPAACGAVQPWRIVQARDSLGPAVR